MARNAKSKPMRKPLRATPATPEDRRWAELFEKHSSEELPNIRAVAEKWAGSIAALTGIFSMVVLVKGREEISSLPTTGQTLVAILLGLTILMATIATYQAALAAQGVPIEVNSANFREKYAQATEGAVHRLNSSRRLTVFAVVFLALAIGCTWFWPVEDKETKTYMVVFGLDRPALCGELTTEGENLGLKVAQTGQTIVLNEIVDMVPVTGCP